MPIGERFFPLSRRNQRVGTPWNADRFCAVPVYYFHVCDGAGFCEDPEGVNLPDDETARKEAVRGARALMVEELQRGELNLASFIEVEDERGNHLFTVTFEEVVEIRRKP